MHIPRQALPPPDNVIASISGVHPVTVTAAPSPVHTESGGSATNGVAIALPIVLGVGIVLGATYFVSTSPFPASSLFPRCHSRV